MLENYFIQLVFSMLKYCFKKFVNTAPSHLIIREQIQWGIRLLYSLEFVT